MTTIEIVARELSKPGFWRDAPLSDRIIIAFWLASQLALLATAIFFLGVAIVGLIRFFVK
jgi:hypothetical protein